MPSRGFGVQTFSSPQPMFATTVAAAVNPTPDMFTGNTAPRSMPSKTVMSVVNAAVFRAGDSVQVGVATCFAVQPTPVVKPDGGKVVAVDTVANTITVMGLTRGHAVGEWVVLALPCAEVFVYNLTAGVLFIGEDNTVSATSPYLMGELAQNGSFNMGMPAVGNILETQHLWVSSGGATDSYLAYLLTV